MGLVFLQKAPGKAARLGILAATFNPPTRAHMALAEQALEHVEEVLFALPRVFPHKDYAGAPLALRTEMLKTVAATNARYSAAVADGGLFIEIVRSAHEAYGDATAVTMLCGRDAAERVVNWDYGRPEAFQEMMREFAMLVASRRGEYTPPPEFAANIRSISLPPHYDEISSSDVRERIRRGDAWRHLVPAAIADRIAESYR